MRDAALLIAISFCVGATTIMIVVGASLLRNVREEVAGLYRELPTRAAEDTAEAREANRQKALNELVRLILIRSAPGIAVIACGFLLLMVLSFRILDIATAG